MKILIPSLMIALAWVIPAPSYGQSDLFFLGKWRAPDGTTRVFMEDGRYEIHKIGPGGSGEVSEGRRRYAEEICRMGRNMGNMVISRHRTDCCYAAKMDGTALKLSSVDPLSFSCFTTTLER